MRLIPASTVVVPFVLLGSIAGPAEAGDENNRVVIVPIERWSNVFGGQELVLHFRVVERSTVPDVDGRIQWRYAASQRTLARGESEIRLDEAGVIEIRLLVPQVRDGIIFKTELSLAYVPREEKPAAATFTKTLWLFPKDPFVDQRDVLKERQLLLFDPEGRTADLFEQIELPCREIRNVAVLDDADRHSCLIVGEGTSLIHNRGLPEQLRKFAAGGGTVLMLAPSDGAIPLPDFDAATKSGHARPGELRFRQHDVIGEFDPRLDSEFLPGTDDFAGSKVRLRTRLNRVEMEVAEDGNWPWFNIEFPKTKGRFVFCGFNVVRNWSNGPAPRFLLARLLTPRP